jgi:putative intracellular protease/amidase
VTSYRAALYRHTCSNTMNILMVLTSHDRLGDSGKKTGFWLEEFAAPYYVFKDAGAVVTLASPRGGQPPLDPTSDAADAQTAATTRFKADPAAQAALAATHTLSGMNASDFDAVFYPGGHGPLWDLAEDAQSKALIEAMLAAGKPLAVVCHAPAVLRHAQAADGSSLVKGRRVTGFSNSEERAAGLTEVVPFLVEDMLNALGGQYSSVADWQPHVVADGLLITGQNPASSAPAAERLLQHLRAKP